MTATFSHKRTDFPDGFLFGAATSATQIEGTAFGGAGASHWDTFALTPGNVVRAETAARACDHYHRWAEDLDLVAAAGFDAYRFSINWARLLPEGMGAPNPAAISFYDRLIDGMLERGMQPFITLYHWDLPSTLAHRGGWANRDITGWFTDYALTVQRRFGDRLASTATLNEPWCVAWLSHFLGLHAPGLRDISAAARAMHFTLTAHAEALAALRAEGAKSLGIVLNFEHIEPASPGDEGAAATEEALFNRWFAEALALGRYPAEALEGLERWLPARWQADLDTIRAPLDWLGVNYYRRALKATAPGSPWPASREVEGPLPKTTMGWEILPDGLADRLTKLAQLFPGLPLYVTENGMSANDHIHDGAVADPERIAYVDAHLAACRAAIAAGVPLKGYFYWSLMDNYEWALGYDKRFGLIHVDSESLKRTPKWSYQAFQHMLLPRTLPSR
ncbi:GH1 family beta-glucosidase [Frigidibacter sp. RF13]|uniref:GH1 family beta-glucosidase n=1 Tax=Frigidibacter sp. RF13 TaxID=2997340 RepID=UPI0022704B9D|nr:GH1 family beta-glucosidase [Frigidibacter sp. RF13]MCY1125369.1 GH1 family beta-glucosidase [Frigidibacter sp. RF13]